MISMNSVLLFFMIMLVGLFLLVVAMLFIQHVERKDLYTRIMSKNLAEYNKSDNEAPIQPKSAHDRVLERWRKGRDSN